MKEIEANGNISDIISYLKNESHFDNNMETWFRGQADYSYKLIPSLFRDNYNEAAMFEEFIRRYPDHSNSHKNVFEWLTLMQHYGLPTRLLDWTTNLLVALYFCCNKDENLDGAIFAIQPNDFLSTDYFREFLEILIISQNRNQFYKDLKQLADRKFDERSEINGITLKNWKTDYSNLYNLDNDPDGNEKSKLTSFRERINFPSKFDEIYSNDMSHNFSREYFFKPPHLNPRIRQQHGCFTFHGGKYFEGREFIGCFNMENTKSNLIKIKIKSTDKENLLKELALTGITEATLFPEMEYQAKQIKELYTIR